MPQTTNAYIISGIRLQNGKALNSMSLWALKDEDCVLTAVMGGVPKIPYLPVHVREQTKP